MLSLQTISKAMAGRKLLLVEGNHDRGSRDRFVEFGVEVVKPPYFQGPFGLLHDEAKERPNESQLASFYFAGHLHPSVMIGRQSNVRARLKCFFVRNNCLTLPAFGEFTGSKSITPTRSDQVFAIAEDDLLQLS